MKHIKENTVFFQKLIDECKKEGIVELPSGDYEVGSLFLKSNMTLIIPHDTVIYGSEDLKDYPEFENRVAGIRTDWPGAIINIINCENTVIRGDGMIDGKGEFWWKKYWGENGSGGMLQEYTKKGLRWIVDYDCKRPRNIFIQNSKNIRLSDFSSKDSGFWNIHVLYSENIIMHNLLINNGKGPSTDGIDIDSCHNVLINKCDISCNDDNICIKSGRGKEAFDNNRCCENIKVKGCRLGFGEGITIGSEVSGGIENIEIEDITFNQTDIGFRIKSSKNRGGFIRNISVNKFLMRNVKVLFSFDLEWFPEYSYGSNNYLDILGSSKHLLQLQNGVIGTDGLTNVGNIKIKDIKSTLDCDFETKIFKINGNNENKIKCISLSDLNIEASTFGEIKGVENIIFDKLNFTLENKPGG